MGVGYKLMRPEGTGFVFFNISLVIFLKKNLKAPHYSSKVDFMRQGKSVVVPYFIIQDACASLQ